MFPIRRDFGDVEAEFIGAKDEIEGPYSHPERTMPRKISPCKLPECG